MKAAGVQWGFVSSLPGGWGRRGGLNCTLGQMGPGDHPKRPDPPKGSRTTGTVQLQLTFSLLVALLLKQAIQGNPASSFSIYSSAGFWN